MVTIYLAAMPFILFGMLLFKHIKPTAYKESAGDDEAGMLAFYCFLWPLVLIAAVSYAVLYGGYFILDLLAKHIVDLFK